MAILAASEVYVDIALFLTSRAGYALDLDE